MFSQVVLSFGTTHHEPALPSSRPCPTTRNLDAFARTVRPGAVLILPSGRIIDGKPAIVDFHRAFFADLTWTQTYTEQARTVTCDTATVVLQTCFIQRDAAGSITYEARNVLGLTSPTAGAAGSSSTTRTPAWQRPRSRQRLARST